MGRTACTEPQCLYNRAIPLLPLWAVRPVQSLSACTVELHLYSPYGPYGLYRASVPVQGYTLPLPYHCVQQRTYQINAITIMTGGRVEWFGCHDLDTSKRLSVVVLPVMRAFLSYTRPTVRSLEKEQKRTCAPAPAFGLRPLRVNIK
jgi:hypothetical protein